MEYSLKEGLSYSKEIAVDKNQTASFYGSGCLEVYATPALVALMENAAMNCVQDELPEGFTTVGIEINVKHIKATPVNMKVRAEAVLEKIDRKRLFFKVEAYDEKGKVGEGTHVRYIVNSEEFLSRLK
ncbi:thioesterase family protein [Clostridium swellfunianum]|uniref:thioesterase family protein n=1 Tax=Clostridium swellfunianum TaxID=1367462 RepID=UPI0020304299|nr:thioesterase family protein [Clostridium swellfunianum]